MRGYLAGTTSTSVLTQYSKGVRAMYGHVLPEGLRDNQVLARADHHADLQGLRRRRMTSL